jgi:hypothetical protein
MIQDLWWKYSKKGIFLIIISFTASLGQAQVWTELQAQYQGYNEYIIQESQSYSISVEKNKLKVLSDNYYESVILSDLGIHNNQESFVYSQLIPLKSFEAYSIINQQGKERKIPVANAVDVAMDQRNVFHSDVKEKKLTFSGLHVGAKKIYKYQNEFVDPYLLHKFIFNNDFPAAQHKLEILADKNIEIGFKIFNDPQNQIQFTKTDKKGKQLFSWTMNNNLPLKYEEYNPGYLYAVPHIVFYIQNYQVNNQVQPVLGSVDLLYDYYKNFTKDLNLEEDENLKSTTLSIVEGLSSEEEKIKAIFYWVQNNIKYVAFEEAYEGFIPRQAKLVYERKFGDCKDMSSIITEMAKYAQIPNVNLTWIGSRNIPYTYHEVPTPAVDDHMIATYKTASGKIIFLDATDSMTKFGLPSSFIQGKESMIQNGETYTLVTVPVVESKENLSKLNVNLRLENSILKGKATTSLNGLARSNHVAMVGDAQNKKRHDILKSLLQLGNNKFQLINYKENNLTNKDLPYEIDFEFELDNYSIPVGNETYINLFLEKPFENFSLSDDRFSMVDFDFLLEDQYRFTLEIPDGMKVSYFPINVKESNSLMDYSIDYTLKDNQIVLDFKFSTKKLLLKKEDFSLWKSSIHQLKSHYNESIIITKS